MDCFILGSGGMMPMPGRRLTSVGLRLEGELYLLDAGEGVQVPYKELHLGLRRLRLVAITHLHADHVLGLPGLLMLRAQVPESGPLDLVGPPGLRRYVNNVRRDLAMYINYEIRIKEWSEEAGDLAYEDHQVRLRWTPVEHTVFCLGYRLEQRRRPGRFDPDRARELGLDEGPLWGQLQRGEAVVNAQGERVQPEQVLGPARRGLRVAYVTDTAPCAGAAWALSGADLAFVESMFLPELVEDAEQKKHMTVEQSARLALDAGVSEVVLVHISPRHDDREVQQMGRFARQIHPRIRVARDGETFQLKAPE